MTFSEFSRDRNSAVAEKIITAALMPPILPALSTRPSIVSMIGAMFIVMLY